jgi:ABC-type transport system substrate-binding protein
VQKGTDGTANMIAAGATRLDGSILIDYFHSKNAATGFNWAKSKNADLDKLLDSAPLAADRASQAAIYQQAEEMIMTNALLLPIQDYAVVSGMSSRLKGVVFRPDGREALLYGASLDK